MYKSNGCDFYRFLSRVVLNDLFRFLRGRYESFLQNVRASISICAQDVIIALCCFVERATSFFLCLIPIFTRRAFSKRGHANKIHSDLALNEVASFAFTAVGGYCC